MDLTQAQVDAATERIENIIRTWQPLLGLEHWTITRKYRREGFAESREGWATLAWTSHDWAYLKATISFALNEFIELDDNRAEEETLHELMHLIVDELTHECNDREKHTDRTATLLAKAFQRVRKAGDKTE